MIKNTKDQYGNIAKFFHWAAGFLVLAMMVMGSVMVSSSGALRPALIVYHRALGLVLLALVVLRLLWTLRGPRPALPPSVPALQRCGVRAAHISMYAIMIAMPIVGWIMVSASGQPIGLPGGGLLPALISPDPYLYILAKWTHRVLAAILAAFIMVHVAGALYHLFVAKDGVFQRMG